MNIPRFLRDAVTGELTQLCDDCDAFGEEDDYGDCLCPICRREREQARAERIYEDSLTECFRGGEAAAFRAERQEAARRLK